MKKAAIFLLLVICLVSLAACSQGDESSLPPVVSGTVVVTPEASVPNIEPSIRGYITRIIYSAESTEILVESQVSEDSEQTCAYEKAIVKLDVNTAIVADNDQAVTVASLAVGMMVESWFNDPTAESYPVLAYGQAVRIITKADSMTGANGLPQLVLSCGGSYSTVVINAEWKDRVYNFSPLNTQLDNMLGASVSASAGDTITLNFSDIPKSVTASCSSSPAKKSPEIPVEELSRIIIPQDTTGELYFRIKAEWDNGFAEYGFSVIVIEPQNSEGLR